MQRIVQNSDTTDYQYKTGFFGIPVPGKEALKSSVEKKKWTIVENQLVAATKGVYCAVFEDGEYRVIDNVDGTYTVMLVGTGHEYALMGILNGGLVFTEQPVVWEKLQKGKTYWLYLVHQQGQYLDPSDFLPDAKNIKVEDGVNQFLLLARFDGNTATVDSCPPGKVYSTDIPAHMNDANNPHGEKLTQQTVLLDNLLHRRVDNRGVVSETTLYDGNGNGLIDGVLRRKVVGVDAESIGPAGVKVVVPGAVRIHLATVTERVVFGAAPTFNLGDAVLQYGIDGLAGNEVAVYNSRSSGVPIRLTVIADFMTE